ncbi:uncharacterized protein LOC142340415 [Convolutriloba macropyga]|uniref:uncharacterized protein LOC142340415 n=1 Tax=Convolutriloba macropyga TaxID=536237 RepID=UPI003F51CB76
MWDLFVVIPFVAVLLNRGFCSSQSGPVTSDVKDTCSEPIRLAHAIFLLNFRTAYVRLCNNGYLSTSRDDEELLVLPSEVLNTTAGAIAPLLFSKDNQVGFFYQSESPQTDEYYTTTGIHDLLLSSPYVSSSFSPKYYFAALWGPGPGSENPNVFRVVFARDPTSPGDEQKLLMMFHYYQIFDDADEVTGEIPMSGVFRPGGRTFHHYYIYLKDRKNI